METGNVMIQEQLLSPGADELAAFLRRHTQKRDCLVRVAGLAEVTYHGRATSTVDRGSCPLLLKRDGSVRVHSPKGVESMNWQQRTDDLSAFVEDGQCVLIASRWSWNEVVRMVFLEAALALAFALTEEAGFVLAGSEPGLQGALTRNPNPIGPGLHTLKRESLVDSGGIDLYAQGQQLRYVGVEVRRGRALQDEVSPLGQSVASVQRTVGNAVVREILAAPSITAPAPLQLGTRNFESCGVRTLALPEPKALQPSLFGEGW